MKTSRDPPLTTAFVTTSPAGTKPVSSITWAVYRDVNSLDPIYAFDYPENTVISAMCESLLLLQSAAKGYGGSDITGTTLRDGLRQLGSRISSGATYRTFFSTGHQWAPSVYRPMTFSQAQNRFVYDASPVPFT